MLQSPLLVVLGHDNCGAVKAAIERSQVDRAIRLWARCMETNVWPAYGGRIVQIEPRPWDLAAEERRLIEDEMEAMQ